MKFYNKIKWVLGITMIFVLVITTNLIDRNNFVRVKDSVVNIYEDRLVAKNLIYKISKAIHKKELAILKNDTTFYQVDNRGINQNIKSNIESFEQTKLTLEEADIFKDLKSDLEQLKGVEKKYINQKFKNNSKILNLLSNINSKLDDLANIQLNEGSRQMSISKKAIENVELFTQLEIYFLIGLAILIQIIIIYRPGNSKK
ncbi:MCP four helix bundle domain-containing protein [Mesohalobacter halotolerans]|uniref:Chemotaxis protein n=1 Tax=Mesohalobacter halotolerans TaxID=1883405 RepID=A0A4U5TNQ5_9FLAO|nr:MCP four helix bundle domain-containing protein [Mesohalobacter halotolerans]MBS3739569.1 MCP four helix bundle domain-containing protein [Psychroflexus sp.]TKS55422.1 chemotaxis protein [Mesohalobacter halotolerans]